jgi:pyruvate/2-oxoacid:ferredoxin oxidoreductase alpha subunit
MAQTNGSPASVTVDGNEAAARVAYKLSDVIAIYPITPSSSGPTSGQPRA